MKISPGVKRHFKAAALTIGFLLGLGGLLTIIYAIAMMIGPPAIMLVPVIGTVVLIYKFMYEEIA